MALWVNSMFDFQYIRLSNRLTHAKSNNSHRFSWGCDVEGFYILCGCWKFSCYCSSYPFSFLRNWVSNRFSRSCWNWNGGREDNSDVCVWFLCLLPHTHRSLSFWMKIERGRYCVIDIWEYSALVSSSILQFPFFDTVFHKNFLYFP